MYVSDEDRQRVVTQLTKHCGDGRLTLDELEQRIEEVYAARTDDDLRHVLRELPPFRDAHRPAAPVFDARGDRAAIDRTIDLGSRRRARPAAAHRGGCQMAASPVGFFLIPLIVLLFVTSHVFLGVMLLFFVLPKKAFGPRHRSYART